MNKTAIMVVIAALLVVGGIFAAAQFNDVAPIKSTETKATTGLDSGECGCGCNGQCDGSCGVEGCSCAKIGGEQCSGGCNGQCTGGSCGAKSCGCNK